MLIIQTKTLHDTGGFFVGAYRLSSILRQTISLGFLTIQRKKGKNNSITGGFCGYTDKIHKKDFATFGGSAIPSLQSQLCLVWFR